MSNEKVFERSILYIYILYKLYYAHYPKPFDTWLALLRVKKLQGTYFSYYSIFLLFWQRSYDLIKFTTLSSTVKDDYTTNNFLA